MSLQGWINLSCDCGNEHFQQAYRITWHESNGTATKPDGHVCTGCGKRSDTGRMISRAKQIVLERRISELQSERA